MYSGLTDLKDVTTANYFDCTNNWVKFKNMKKLILLLSVLFVVSCSPEPILYMLTTSVSPVDTGVVIPSARQYNSNQ